MKQSREVFNEAVAMRDKHPDLRAAIDKYGNSPVLSLYVRETNSRLTPLAKGADSSDGLVSSASFIDELHRWKSTDNLWPVLRYGGDTRNQPMLVCITTAGASAGKSSLCWSEHEYITRILDGLAEDDEVAGFIFSLDLKDDIKDEANWIKPNPSLGTILPLSALQNQYKEAKGKPAAMGEYKRYRLNIWTDEASEPAIEIDYWNACCIEDYEAHPDPRRLRKELIEQLKGRRCYGGADLAPKHDTSALVLVFAPEKQGDKWIILEWFWIPADNLTDRVANDKVPYDLWQKDGFLETTEGSLTDYRYIANQIIEVSKQFDLHELYYDESWSNELIRMLIEAGFPMKKVVPFKQGHREMNPACIEFMRLVESRQLAHANNPVMRWQVGNLRWHVQKATGFLKPARDRKREKIDGCSALLCALACATSPDNLAKPKKSFWVVSA